MDISIIIACYNSETTIRKSVLSVLNSDFDKKYEVIVVNDGSTDKSIEQIKDLNVHVIHQKNKGAASARNAGVKQALSDLILFVDADVVLFRDTLGKIYEHLKKDDVDYVTARYSKKPLNHRWIHRYRALADFSYYYDFIYTKEQKQKPIRQEIIGGGVEGYKKKVFEELGGFDENIKGANIEQEKLISKLLKGYNVLADGNIRTQHYFAGLKKLVKDYFNRTFHLMDLVYEGSYRQSYLEKNMIRIALGALTVVLLFFSLVTFLFFGYTVLFITTLMVFLAYFIMHFNMFAIAFKEYGFFFMVYTLIINLFFCTLISTAGFLSTIKVLFAKQKI